MKRSLLRAKLAAPLLAFVLSASSSARERAPLDAFYAAPRAAGVPRAGAGGGGAVAAHLDARRDVPTFVWGDRDVAPSAATFEGAAKEHLARNAALLGLAGEALDHVRVVSVHDTGRGGVLVVLRQRVAGIDVVRQDAKLLLDRDRRLVAIGGALHPAALPSARLGAFVLSDAAALAAALTDLHGLPFGATDFVPGPTRGAYRTHGLAADLGGVRFRRPARIVPVWFPLPDRLVPAWKLELDTRAPGGDDAYAYVISAEDGAILFRSNLTHDATFAYRVWADASGDHRPTDGPLGDYTPHPTGMPDGGYPAAVAPPLLSMDGFNVTKDAWLPEGAQETNGNNVDAYTDDDAPDGFSKNDVRAKVTAPGTFDRVYDLQKGPQDDDQQRMASVTQVFYTTNWLHDFWYDSGFDEKGHNAQKSNYGRGGEEDDPLLCEAQNGAPAQRDNANMSAFEDGSSPRMQMFVWEGGGGSTKVVATPGGSSKAGAASFGPQSFDLTGDLVLADDGTAPKEDACQALPATVKGKIVLVQRGMCPFSDKAQAVEAAGGIAMLLFDNTTSNQPPPLGGGEGLKISIPALSVTKASGDALTAALASGAVKVTMTRVSSPDRDGTIDNTVVAHEWGHYLHLRNVSCGSQACFAESEGWGDFTALQMVIRAGDDTKGAYPLSQYASGGISGDAGYFGIRRYPYSTDKTKNPLTFKHIMSGEKLPTGVPVSAAQNDNAEVHAAGEVWAAMLFEAFAALLDRSKEPNPPYDFDGARRRMADYVVQGLALAPVDPTYTEQRDAILAAAAARDAEDVKVLSEAFARRGAGTCAVSPPRDSVDFKGVVESFEVASSVNVVSITLDDSVSSCDQDGFLDQGEKGNVKVVLRNVGTSKVTGAKATLSTKSSGASFPSGATVVVPDMDPFGKAEVTVPIAWSPTTKQKTHLDLSVALDNVAVCTNTSTLVASPFVDVDEVTVGSFVDDVEASSSNFGPTGAFAKRIWSRIEVAPGNHVWAGVDYGSPSDTRLESPSFPISETEPFVLSWKHRHQFETSMDIFWDGGVVEVTTDGGKTWEDARDHADVPYGGTIGDPQKQAKNALRGRLGFVDTNASYPAFDEVKLDFGTAFAGKTLAFRFRIGTDDAAGGLGWQVDDITVSGAATGPFSALVADADKCGKGTGGKGGAAGSSAGSSTKTELTPADASGGCDCAVPSGESSAASLGALFALGLVARRRRRAPRAQA